MAGIPERATNTTIEGLNKIGKSLFDMKAQADNPNDLQFISNLETAILQHMRAPQDAVAQQQSGQGMPGAPALDPATLAAAMGGGGAPGGMAPGGAPPGGPMPGGGGVNPLVALAAAAAAGGGPAGSPPMPPGASGVRPMPGPVRLPPIDEIRRMTQVRK